MPLGGKTEKSCLWQMGNGWWRTTFQKCHRKFESSLVLEVVDVVVLGQEMIVAQPAVFTIGTMGTQTSRRIKTSAKLHDVKSSIIMHFLWVSYSHSESMYWVIRGQNTYDSIQSHDRLMTHLKFLRILNEWSPPLASFLKNDACLTFFPLGTFRRLYPLPYGRKYRISPLG